MKIAVFVSGRGSNLQSIVETVPSAKAIVSAVISNKADCPAFLIAEKYKIPHYCVSNVENEGFINYFSLIDILNEGKIELIVLAGFLKKIPDHFVDAFKNRIINIHPALLPFFGGKGMYGINVHNAVFNAGMKVSGATVHFVDKIFDNGLIIAQRAVDISDADSPESIAKKVLAVEHELLPFVVEKIADGKVIVENNKPKILS